MHARARTLTLPRARSTRARSCPDPTFASAARGWWWVWGVCHTEGPRGGRWVRKGLDMPSSAPTAADVGALRARAAAAAARLEARRGGKGWRAPLAALGGGGRGASGAAERAPAAAIAPAAAECGPDSSAADSDSDAAGAADPPTDAGSTAASGGDASSARDTADAPRAQGVQRAPRSPPLPQTTPGRDAAERLLVESLANVQARAEAAAAAHAAQRAARQARLQALIAGGAQQQQQQQQQQPDPKPALPGGRGRRDAATAALAALGGLKALSPGADAEHADALGRPPAGPHGAWLAEPAALASDGDTPARLEALASRVGALRRHFGVDTTPPKALPAVVQSSTRSPTPAAKAFGSSPSLPGDALRLTFSRSSSASPLRARVHALAGASAGFGSPLGVAARPASAPMAAVATGLGTTGDDAGAHGLVSPSVAAAREALAAADEAAAVDAARAAARARHAAEATKVSGEWFAPARAPSARAHAPEHA